ncbi:MAG: NINE protein [Treponema sp.]|nr:NINE protein [Treponema sp.]
MELRYLSSVFYQKYMVLFSGFLGIFGIDRFYAKRKVTGIIKLLLGLPLILITVSYILSLISKNFIDWLQSSSIQYYSNL